MLAQCLRRREGKMDARWPRAALELTQGFHKRKIGLSDRGVRPMAAPLEELLDW